MSVLLANQSVTNYSSQSTWLQPSYFPEGSSSALSSTYIRQRRDCFINCSLLFPQSTTLLVTLAYGNCYCGNAPLSDDTVYQPTCCVPLSLTCGPNNCSSNESHSVGSRPAACEAGQVYGQVSRVSLRCPLNGSYCGSSCSFVSGCCSVPSTPASGEPALESAAAQWLVALLLVAVVFQLGYWVIKLRLCRNRQPIAQRHQLQRQARGNAGTDELQEAEEMNEDLLAQLNGIAQRMRLALLRRQRAAMEPKRTKEEALDAAAEAVSLFADVVESEVDSEECCPMCLDELKCMPCVRVLCGHVMHRDCMKEFLAHKLVSYAAPVTCPMCRAVVLVQNTTFLDVETDAQASHDLLHPLLWDDGGGEPAAQSAPQHRRRRNSRGRRFRVAQANLTAERLIHRRVQETDSNDNSNVATDNAILIDNTNDLPAASSQALPEHEPPRTATDQASISMLDL